MEIETLVSSVGFPIGAFFLIWQQNNGILKEVKKSVDSLTAAIEGRKIRVVLKKA